MAVLRAYIELAEKLGRFQAQLVDSAVREVKLEFAGDIVELNAAPVTRSFLAGLLRDVSARVNAVNAFLIAEERGISVTTSYFRAGSDFAPSIRTRVAGNNTEQSLAGTIFGFGEQAREGRITEIDGFHIEATPQGHMLVMRNRDVPGGDRPRRHDPRRARRKHQPLSSRPPRARRGSDGGDRSGRTTKKDRVAAAKLRFRQKCAALTGTAGVSPASSYKFTQVTVESVTLTKWHSTKAGETPAVPVKAGTATKKRI